MDMKEIIGFQKKAGKSLLKSLSSLLKTDVYLAGGMLRDHYFQRSGNDFDVYVKRNPSFEYETWMTSLLNGTHGYSDFKLMEGSERYAKYGKADTSIYQIYEGYFSAHHVKTQTQVIVLESLNPRKYIENYFCCSLSKAWQTQDFDPVFSTAFMESIKTNTLAFDFSKLGEINFGYIDKIMERFPDFEVDETTKRYYIDKFTREAYWKND